MKLILIFLCLVMGANSYASESNSLKLCGAVERDSVPNLTPGQVEILLRSLPDVLPLTSCMNDITCPPGSFCINGFCKYAGTCLSDLDCPIGKKCVVGSCKFP